ncbi:MAG: FecR domain-containing protein, partial [Desulfovibrio sp.]|nr:FecR domain-containing protein [Desulfovibrio sp.]
MKLVLLWIALCLSCMSFPAPLVAADNAKPAGYVQEAAGEVLALHGGQSRPLEAKAPVWQGDTLATKSESSVQIMFSDGTILAMGPESLLVIKEYVNEWGLEKTLTNTMRLSYGPGIFRAVTGIISDRNPGAAKIDTPLGHIGIRGTELASLVTAPAQAGGKPFGAALNDIFADKGNAAAGLDSLLAVASASVSQEAHGHIAGSKNRPLAFTDNMGKSVDMAVAQGVTVTRERGVSEPGPIPQALETSMPMAFINYEANIPAAFRSILGGSPGTDRNAPNSGSFSGTSGTSGGSTSGGRSGGGRS